jgi:hypothetical protein
MSVRASTSVVRFSGRLGVVGALALVLCGLLASTASAAFGIAGFDGRASQADGSLFTQAGGHPASLTTRIDFNTTLKATPVGDIPFPDEAVKDILVDAPAGLVGSPASVARCTVDQLGFGGDVLGPTCPSASQVGVATVTLTFGRVFLVPVYNMTAPPDVTARFGFNVLGVVVLADAEVRTGSDNGVSFNVHNVSEGTALLSTELTLWGVPSDSSHDADRSCPGESIPQGGGPSCATDAKRVAFLRFPTSCGVDPGQGMPFTLRADSLFHPGVFVTSTFFTHQSPGLFDGLPPDQWGPQQGVTGCGDVPFDPSFSARPARSVSPGASGYAFDLTLPQTDDPGQLGESDLRKVVVTLPQGVRVNPSSANGLGACSPAQIGLGSTGEPSCPDSSKIGKLEIITPVLEEPLEGSVYLATPHQNPSGSLIAVYLVARGPGLVIKLAGGVSPSASNDGQLTARFENLPQTPFSSMHLEFFGGDRAALSNPPRCGTYTTHAILTGWSGKTVDSVSSFTTSHDGHGAPCPPARFTPGFSAGTTNPVAGKHSPMSVTISRTDDDEEIGAVDGVQLPNGLLATIAGVPQCSATAASTGTCPVGSRIGSVTAAAGAGTDPFAVTGTVYLGGPYKGAPFSVIFEVPVIAGPFDLGQITIRGALQIDRHDATARIVTDPLPTILQGIPLQVRVVHVAIDRKGFILNPTSCARKQITGTLRSTTGTIAHVSDRFQVLGCPGLALHPRFSIRVGGKGHTAKGATTPLKTVLTMPKGGTNLKTVGVSLPLSLNARLDVVNNACTRAQFETGHCEDARTGTATATTPLLDKPLRGGVYFVKDPTKPTGALPNLIIALRGQVPFDLIGTIKIPHGTTLATHFTTVPDVPVKKFVLNLTAGQHGSLGVAQNLCSPSARSKTATITFTGQNNKTLVQHQHLHVTGCPRARHG